MDDRSNQHVPATLHIGIWGFHPEACRITSNGQEVRLTPKSAHVLTCLAERAGEVVTPDELLERFWRGTLASPNAVHKCIAELRHAFGNGTSGPGYIETIPKRGYRLVAPVEWVAVTNHQPIDAKADAAETRLLPLTAGHTEVTNGAGRTPTLRARWAKFSITGLGAILGLVAIVAFFMQTTSTIIDAPMVKIGNRTAVLLPPAANSKRGNDLEMVRQILDRVATGFGSSGDATVEVRRLELSSGQQGNEAVAWNTDYGVQVEVANRSDQLYASLHLQPSDPKRLAHQEDIVYPADKRAAFIDAVSTEVHNDLTTLLDDRSVDEMARWGTSNLHAYHLAKKADSFRRIQTVASLLRAEPLYQQAIQLDSRFEYAYLMLSETYRAIAQSPTNTEVRERVRMASQNLLRDARTASRNPRVIHDIERDYDMLSAGTAFDSESLIRKALQRRPDDTESLMQYAQLLLGAKLLLEGEAYLDRAMLLARKIPDPQAVSSVESIHATLLVLTGPPEAAIQRMKRNVETWPDFTISLNGLMKELTKVGRMQEARFYLARLKSSDEAWGAFSEAQMVAISGEAKLASARMEDLLKNPLISNAGRGDVCFILGEVECGIRFWHELEPAFLPLFWWFLPVNESYYPMEVLTDARYQAMLEQLGIGKTWRAYMRERASEMSQVTGIEVSKDVSPR
jgi:DNA-binding winged helix-turn-helix (wHTH) protein/tetratricopeptide (TPR) repeat protein